MKTLALALVASLFFLIAAVGSGLADQKNSPKKSSGQAVIRLIPGTPPQPPPRVALPGKMPVKGHSAQPAKKINANGRVS